MSRTQNFLNLGTVPYDEPCAQVGQPGYHEKANKECLRFMSLIRKKFGNEPEGARLKVKWYQHDLGSYADVIILYIETFEDEDDTISERYAYEIEGNLPATWDDDAFIGTVCEKVSDEPKKDLKLSKEGIPLSLSAYDSDEAEMEQCVYDSVRDVVCPHCNCTRTVETDAEYVVTCEACREKFQVHCVF